MPEERLSLTGEKSIFEVPSGTEVIITGVTEKPIANAWVIPKVGQIPGAKPGSAAPVSLRITDRSKDNGMRDLKWSEVTDALVASYVPAFPLQKLRLDQESRTPSANAAAWPAAAIIRRVRHEPTVRDRLKSEMGDSGLVALALVVRPFSSLCAACLDHLTPLGALERVFTILDEKYRDNSGRYVLPLGTTFVLEFTGDNRFVKRAQPYEFDLVYENVDRVESTRSMLIHVREDQAPVVEMASDVIRRVGNVYYVTPRAKIPFVKESYVKDDNGLSKVEYTYTLYPEDSDLARSMRAAMVTRAIIPPVGNCFPAVVQGVYHVGAHSSLDRGDNRTNGSFLQGGFLDQERKLKRETKAYLEQLLASPLTGEAIKLVNRYELKWNRYGDRSTRPNGTLESFKWVMEGDYFDLAALKLEVQSGDIQPRYRIDLNLQATDTNFDTGPKTSSNTDPIRLLVVSAGDLLVEIGKEEEALGAKLDEALGKLAACRANYAFVNSKHLTRLPDEVEAVKVKSKGVALDVAKAKELLLNVGRAFQRIQQETVINQLDDRTIAFYGKFANRIDRVLGETPQVISPDEDEQIQNGKSETLPFGLLTPKSTFPAVEKSMASVEDLLEKGQYADPDQASEADLRITMLEQEVSLIRAILGEAQSKERLLKTVRDLIEKQEQVQREIKIWQRIIEGEFLVETPAIGRIGDLFLAKGESRKVKHTLNWRNYKKDDLVVKVAVSDPSVVVPNELKLSYENNSFDFSYEIRAGTKEGDFKITLTPEVGDKVEMKVTVK